MRRVLSTLLVLAVACLVTANLASAQEKKKRPDPGTQFDEMEKAVKHDPLKGELTKDEFVAATKIVSPDRADRAEQLFERITKADPKKVTKDEYVKFIKEMISKGGGKRGGKKPQ